MQKFYGDSTHWGIGVVEDIQDPLNQGRVRVRIHGLHTFDTNTLAIHQLPWSHVAIAANNAGTSGVGQTPTGLVEGSFVFGVFLDGEDKQDFLVTNALTGTDIITNRQGQNLFNITESLYGDSNSERMYSYFREVLRFTEEEAAGALGAVAQFMGTYDLSNVDIDHGEGRYGLGNWNETDTAELRSFASASRNNFEEFDTQLLFLGNRLQHSDSWPNYSEAGLQLGAFDASQASDSFATNVLGLPLERDQRIRHSYARQALDAYGSSTNGDPGLFPERGAPTDLVTGDPLPSEEHVYRYIRSLNRNIAELIVTDTNTQPGSPLPEDWADETHFLITEDASILIGTLANQPVENMPEGTSVTADGEMLPATNFVTSQEMRDQMMLWEGLRNRPYVDAYGYSIGYGYFIGTDSQPERFEAFSERWMGRATSNRDEIFITDEQARELFDESIVRFEREVYNSVTVDITQSQFDSLVALTYNLGNLTSSAGTLIGNLNSGNYAAAADSFTLYTSYRNANRERIYYPADDVTRALHGRRLQEAEFFRRGLVGADGLTLRDHRQFSIVVTFQGGQRHGGGRSTSYTEEQTAAFREIAAATIRSYPAVSIIGLRDLDETSNRPVFDVRQFFESSSPETTSNPQPAPATVPATSGVVASAESAGGDIARPATPKGRAKAVNQSKNSPSVEPDVPTPNADHTPAEIDLDSDVVETVTGEIADLSAPTPPVSIPSPFLDPILGPVGTSTGLGLALGALSGESLSETEVQALIDSSLQAYYTSVQVDGLLVNYYTSTQVDNIFSGYYTSNQVDSLIAGLTSSLNDLTDVTITTPSTGQYLRYSGAGWANATIDYSDIANTPTSLPPASHTHVLADITDLSSTSDLPEGTNLYYTATRVNSAIDTRVNKVFVDSLNVDADTLDGQHGSYYRAWSNLTGVPSTFAPSAHTHTVSEITDYVTATNSAIDTRVNKSFVDSLNVDAGTLDGINSTSFIRGDSVNNGGTTITVDDADFVVADSTDGTANYIWRDHSAGLLYLGTSNATVTMRSQLNMNAQDLRLPIGSQIDFDDRLSAPGADALMRLNGTAIIQQVSDRGALNISSRDDTLILGNGDNGRNFHNEIDPSQENTWIVSDSHVYVVTGLQTGYDSVNKQFRFGADGEFYVGNDQAFHAGNSSDLARLSATDQTFTGNMIVSGNLTVNGTQTVLNTTELTIDDNIILLNAGETGIPSLNAGIEVERGTSANVRFRWNETSDKWQVTENGTNYYDILIDDGVAAGNADTVDGLQSWQFLRSDAIDYKTAGATIFHNALDIQWLEANGSYAGTRLYKASSNVMRFAYTGDGFIFDALDNTEFQVRDSSDAIVFRVASSNGNIVSTGSLYNNNVYTTTVQLDGNSGGERQIRSTGLTDDIGIRFLSNTFTFWNFTDGNSYGTWQDGVLKSISSTNSGRVEVEAIIAPEVRLSSTSDSNYKVRLAAVYADEALVLYGGQDRKVLTTNGFSAASITKLWSNNTVALTLDASQNATLAGSLTLPSGVAVSSILDEDTLSSNSATALATQQSIKAYVDGAVSGVNPSGNYLPLAGGTLTGDLNAVRINTVRSVGTAWVAQHFRDDTDATDIAFVYDGGSWSLRSEASTTGGNRYFRFMSNSYVDFDQLPRVNNAYLATQDYVDSAVSTGVENIDGGDITSGTISHERVREIDIFDSRNDTNVDPTPAQLGASRFRTDFRLSGSPTGGWRSVLSMTGWTNGSYSSHQLSFNSHTTNGGDHKNLYHRSGLNSTWDSWRKIWDDNNFDPTAQPASNITSGTFSSDRIPNLDASKITSGTLGASYIPTTFVSGSNYRFYTVDGFDFDTETVVNRPTLEIYQGGGSGKDAVIKYHIAGDYAAYMGLDGGYNDFVVGGYSMGVQNKYRLFHEGNVSSLLFGTSNTWTATQAFNNGITSSTITASSEITANGGISIGSGQHINHNASQSRDKIRVWNSSLYCIGMQSGYTYGHLNNDYAMTFQMNEDVDRGWWWGHQNHTNSQGAMSLTTNGRLWVETDITAPTLIATGASLLRRYVAWWSNEPNHDIIYNSWLSSHGDYVYLKSAGNTSADHGMIIVADNAFYVGEANIMTGGVSDSSSNPMTGGNTWLKVNNSGVDGNARDLFNFDYGQFGDRQSAVRSDASLTVDHNWSQADNGSRYGIYSYLNNSSGTNNLTSDRIRAAVYGRSVLNDGSTTADANTQTCYGGYFQSNITSGHTDGNYGSYNIAICDGGADSNAENLFGALGEARLDNAGSVASTMRALYGIIRIVNDADQTVSTAYGVDTIINQDAGTIDNVYSHSARIDQEAGATIGIYYGFYSDSFSGADGTITNERPMWLRASGGGRSSINGRLHIGGENTFVSASETLHVDGESYSRDGFRVGDRSGHRPVDGAFYRTGAQVYLSVDDNLYIRDTDGTDSFRFQTGNANNILFVQGRNALADVSDGWLRINNVGNYTNGIYTPGNILCNGTVTMSQAVVSGNLTVSGSTVWHAGNDGSGSGLDADLLDGLHASQFLRSDASDAKTSGSLHLYDNIELQLGTGSGGDAVFCHSGVDLKLDVTTGSFVIYDNGVSKWTFLGNDSGDFTAAGNVTAYSDIRLKDVGDAVSTFDIIDNLTVFDYFWKDSGKASRGVLAQDVQTYAPWFVTRGNDDTLSVDYGKLATAAVYEEKKKREALEDKVEKLEAMVEILMDKINALTE